MISKSETTQSPEIDFIEIFILSLAHKRLVLLITFLGLAISTLGCYLLENEYTSYGTIAPAMEDNSSLISTLSNSFSGLGGLAGINLSPTSGENEKALAILKSREFIRYFIEKHKLMDDIFYKSWDKTSSNWRKPGLLQHTQVYIDRAFNSLTTHNDNFAPSMEKAYMLFTNEILSVNPDKKTGLISISVTTHDAFLSASILENYIKDSNAYIKNRKNHELKRNIAYLKDKLEETKVTDIRLVLNDLIRNNMQNIMLSETKDEFAFETIDRPAVPERHSAPNRLAIVVISTIASLALGCAASFLNAKHRQPLH